MSSREPSARKTSPIVADLPVGLEEAVLAHPGVVDELGQVVADRVGQDHDHALSPRASSCATCSAAHTAAPREPPTSKPSWRISWRAIRNESRSLRLDPAVDQRAVEHVGDEVVADALDLVALDLAGAGQDRALGVDADDLAVGQLAS